MAGAKSDRIMIFELIKRTMLPGTRIPKPRSKETYRFVRWGFSRGEEALVYQIPAKPGTKKLSTKRIPRSVFEEAYETLLNKGEITKVWFANAFPKVDADGSCNFTTLGGIFQILNLAEWAGEGVYRRL